MTRKFRIAILVLGALGALMGLQALASARARLALTEAAKQAADAAARTGQAEAKVLVTTNCEDGQHQAAFVPAGGVPAAEEVAAQVPPGCKLAGVNVTHIRYVLDRARAEEMARAYLAPVRGARLAGFNAVEDDTTPRVTVTVLAERRVLGRTLRAEASATRGVDEAAVAAEASGSLFAAADKLVAERDKAKKDDKAPGRTLQETGPKAGDPLPPEQQKKAQTGVGAAPPTAGEIFDVEKIRRDFSSGPDPNYVDPF